jgi:hypothetical protein
MLKLFGTFCNSVEVWWYAKATLSPPSLPKLSQVEASPPTDPSAGTSAAAKQSVVEASPPTDPSPATAVAARQSGVEAASGSAAGMPPSADDEHNQARAVFYEIAKAGHKLHSIRKTAQTEDLDKHLGAIA